MPKWPINMAQGEFHDLAELQLNINPATQTIVSSWGNLGYWPDTGGAQLAEVSTGYSQACEQLAREVAFMGDINSTHKLLDTGFGCGDQLLLWIQEFNVQTLYGLNLSHSQTQFAKAKITNIPFNENVICEINVADCCQEASWQTLDNDFQRIIALDCIYHFSHKTQYFSLCEQHLVDEGVLVVSDLLLIKEHLPIWHKFLLKSICGLSHIPYENVKTFDQYQQQLADSGLTITRHKDISKQVLLPFGSWLKTYIPSVKDSPHLPKNSSWLKYKGVAKFLAWGYKKNIFSYCILRIEKQTH